MAQFMAHGAESSEPTNTWHVPGVRQSIRLAVDFFVFLCGVAGTAFAVENLIVIEFVWCI